MVKRIWMSLWRLAKIFIIIYVVLITICSLSMNKYGFTQIANTTLAPIDEDSERFLSTAQEGDLLVIKKNKKIEIGDLVYYYSTVNEGYIVRSSVVSKIEKNGSYILSDDERAGVPKEKIIGTKASLYPGMGKILTTIESNLGFIFLVIIPITLIFIIQCIEYIIKYKKENLFQKKKKNFTKEDKSKQKIKNKQSKSKNSETKKEKDIEVL